MSTSMFRWRITLIISTLIVIGGLVVIGLLALGIANPPLGSLHWETSSTDGWRTSYGGGFTVDAAPVEINQSSTLLLTARNSGPASSAWGIKFFNVEAPIEFLISNEGYYTFNPQYSSWEEFPHLRPSEANTISLHVAQNGHGTIRINDEIVTNSIAFFYLPVEWGVVAYAQPQLTWEQIALYHE